LLIVQLHGERLAERGRPCPDVQHDIKNRPSRNSNKLALRVSELVVKPANHPGLRPAVIVLHEVCRQPGCRDLSCVVRLEEEPALVTKYSRREKENSRQPGLLDLDPHRPPSSRAI